MFVGVLYGKNIISGTIAMASTTITGRTLVYAALSISALTSGPTFAQSGASSPRPTAGAPPANAPMTEAPMAPGSTRMHMVPTPIEPKKGSRTGGNAGSG